MKFHRNQLDIHGTFKDSLFSTSSSKFELRDIQVSITSYKSSLSKMESLRGTVPFSYEKRFVKRSSNNTPIIDTQYIYLDAGVLIGGLSERFANKEQIFEAFLCLKGRTLTYALLRKSKLKGIPDAILKRKSK